MNAVAHHRTAVADHLGEVLAVVPLAADDATLTEYLFGQLVNILVEGLFLDLREQRDDARIDASTFAAAHQDLALQCQMVGLLPPGGTDPI